MCSGRAPWCANICGRERRARLARRQDVKNVDAVVVSCALSSASADSNDLASYESRGMRGTAAGRPCVSGWDLCIVSMMMELKKRA